MTSKRPTTNYHHGNLPAALIEAALEILETQGLDALTLREVARRTGVTHAAPYRHFRDKAALLSAVADAGCHELQSIIAFASPAPDAPNNDTLCAIAEAYLQFAQQHPAQYQVMFTESSNAPDDNGSDPLTALRQRIVALGTPHQADLFPPSMACALWSQWHGLATLMLGGRVDFDHALCTVRDTIHMLLGTGCRTPTAANDAHQGSLSKRETP